MATIGYRMDISQVLLKSIFKIKAIPKKMTKYNIMETTSCINDVTPFASLDNTHAYFIINRKKSKDI